MKLLVAMLLGSSLLFVATPAASAERTCVGVEDENGGLTGVCVDVEFCIKEPWDCTTLGRLFAALCAKDNICV